MATRSALTSLPARLRPATAAGGLKRLLSDNARKGRVLGGQVNQDEDKRLKDEQESTRSLKDHPAQAETKGEHIKDPEVEMSPLAKNEKSCLKDQLEQSRKRMMELKDQLEWAEAEKQRLKDQIHKDSSMFLENIVNKEALKIESYLVNHRIFIDESISKMQQLSEEIKEVEIAVESLQQNCLRRVKNSEKEIKVLEEKNSVFLETLSGKVQQTQFNLVKATAIAGLVAAVSWALYLKGSK